MNEQEQATMAFQFALLRQALKEISAIAAIDPNHLTLRRVKAIADETLGQTDFTFEDK